MLFSVDNWCFPTHSWRFRRWKNVADTHLSGYTPRYEAEVDDQKSYTGTIKSKMLARQPRRWLVLTKISSKNGIALNATWPSAV